MNTVITLLSLINGPSDRTLHNGCPSDPQTRYLLPHETDCSKYYNCTNGIKTEMSCDPGTLFDGNLQMCHLASSVDCETSASNLIRTARAIFTLPPQPSLEEIELYVPTPKDEISCPSMGHYTLPFEGNCKKYYECKQGQKVEMLCQSGTMYSYEKQGCVLEWVANCMYLTMNFEGKATDELPNGCPADFSVRHLLPHTSDCSKYYKCREGVKILKSCGSQYFFDNDSWECAPPSEVNCYLEIGEPSPETTTTTIKPLISLNDINHLPNGCPEDFRIRHLLPHTSDCSKYYKCREGVKILKSCGAGTWFDYNYETCTHLAKCYPGAKHRQQNLKYRHHRNFRRAPH